MQAPQDRLPIHVAGSVETALLLLLFSATATAELPMSTARRMGLLLEPHAGEAGRGEQALLDGFVARVARLRRVLSSLERSPLLADASVQLRDLLWDDCELEEQGLAREAVRLWRPTPLELLRQCLREEQIAAADDADVDESAP